MFDVQFLRSEGFRAFEAGLEINDNPYEENTAEYKVWASGWKHAERRFLKSLPPDRSGLVKRLQKASIS